MDLRAIERDEGDFIAIENPDQSKSKHDEEMPLAEREAIELTEGSGVKVLNLFFFFVEVHGGGRGERVIDIAIRKCHCKMVGKLIIFIYDSNLPETGEAGYHDQSPGQHSQKTQQRPQD